MKKKSLLFILSILFSTTLFAQKDAEAKAILK